MVLFEVKPECGICVGYLSECSWRNSRLHFLRNFSQQKMFIMLERLVQDEVNNIYC